MEPIAIPAAPVSTSVSVLISTYNMAWCLERAIMSCLHQTHPPASIIVVDDGSADDTQVLMARMQDLDSRVQYHRLRVNGGQLAALRRGLLASTSDWVALLDADDELTPDSLECRIRAARSYWAAAGQWPQLVYGDYYFEQLAPDAKVVTRSLEGHQFTFLARELSLCPMITMMLGRDAVAHFPRRSNPYNTDDEIVLTVGKRLAVAHAGCAVAIVHAHDSPTRMSNDARKRYLGVAQLVRDHRKDVLSEHGIGRLLLWQLRVLRARAQWQHEWADGVRAELSGATVRARVMRAAVGVYGRITGRLYRRLTVFLRSRFDQLYF